MARAYFSILNAINGSVPPAVAGGSLLAPTHPLSQVVLTRRLHAIAICHRGIAASVAQSSGNKSLLFAAPSRKLRALRAMVDAQREKVLTLKGENRLFERECCHSKRETRLSKRGLSRSEREDCRSKRENCRSEREYWLSERYCSRSQREFRRFEGESLL